MGVVGRSGRNDCADAHPTGVSARTRQASTLDSMHPIERLRYVARATDDGPSMLVREAAGALASFSSDPAALVTACRRLLDRQPQAAPIWWLAARVLASAEPANEAWIASDELDQDATPGAVRNEVPADASVLVFGWPEQVAGGIIKRGDLKIFVADIDGEGSGLVRRLERSGHEPILVDEHGVGSAAAEVDLVLIEALGLGGTSCLATSGSLSAAAVAHHLGKPVWAVAGVGRVLPGRLWDAYARRLDDEADPWDALVEQVPLSLIDRVVGPTGITTPEEALRRADCPIPPELLKSLD
jgi:hypothetical protein